MQAISTGKKIWLVIDLIHWAKSFFSKKGFKNPRREIEHLLCAVLRCKRIDVYLRFEEPLSESQLDTLRSLIKRRLEREPLQYIIGSCEFYGREFSVNKHVLIPRPETERLIDIALEKMKGVDSPSILDVGTGSGCIATTLAIEVPSAKILGIDLSPEALKVSEENKEKLGVDNVIFEELNILDQLPEGPFDLLVSNPPYVPQEEMEGLMKDVKDFEPSVALTDKNDGLTFYRYFSQVAKNMINAGGWLILEVGLDKHPQLAKDIFSQSGFENIQLIKDYNGDDRVLTVPIG